MEDPSATNLNLLVQSVYRMLDLQTFFTTGAKEHGRGRLKRVAPRQKQHQLFTVISRKDLLELNASTGKSYVIVQAGQTRVRVGIIRSEEKDYVVEEGCYCIQTNT